MVPLKSGVSHQNGHISSCLVMYVYIQLYTHPIHTNSLTNYIIPFMSNNYVSLCSYPTTLVLYIPFISTNYCIWSTLMFNETSPFLPVAWATARCPLWVSTLPDAGRTWRSPWPSSNSWSDDICWPSNKLRWKPSDKNIGKYWKYWKTYRKTLKHVGKKLRNVGTLSYRKMINTWWIFSISMLDFRTVNFWVKGRWIDGCMFTGSTLVWFPSHGSRSKLSRKKWFDK